MHYSPAPAIALPGHVLFKLSSHVFVFEYVYIMERPTYSANGYSTVNPCFFLNLRGPSNSSSYKNFEEAQKVNLTMMSSMPRTNCLKSMRDMPLVCLSSCFPQKSR